MDAKLVLHLHKLSSQTQKLLFVQPLSSIILEGFLTDSDDYNDRPAPYNFVRKGGSGGSCFADNYKRGAEFLLFLVEKDKKYWLQHSPLAPVNEQLRSKDDEWLVWVKNQLQILKENKQKQ